MVTVWGVGLGGIRVIRGIEGMREIKGNAVWVLGCKVDINAWL